MKRLRAAALALLTLNPGTALAEKPVDAGVEATNTDAGRVLNNSMGEIHLESDEVRDASDAFAQKVRARILGIINSGGELTGRFKTEDHKKRSCKVSYKPAFSAVPNTTAITRMIKYKIQCKSNGVSFGKSSVILLEEE